MIQFWKVVVVSVSRYRPSRRRFVPWEWARIYVLVVVVYLAAVLLLLWQGQDPAFALGMPAAVGAVALAAVQRLGRLAVVGVSARRRPHRA